MKTSHLVTAAALIGSAVVAALIVARPTPPRLPASLTPPRPLPAGGDFVLRAADGPVDTAALRGRAVVLSFGYTSCPDVCPTTLTTVAAALRELGPDEAQVAPLFVSVDPERDTPERLAEYVRYFHPALRGLTGTAAEIAAVTARYDVEYAKVMDADGRGYSMDHSAEIFVLDRAGRPAARLAYDQPAPALTKAIRAALATGPAPTVATAPPPREAPPGAPPADGAAAAAAPPPTAGAAAVMAHAAWVREVPPGSAVTAAFLMLHNPGPARALVAATSPVAGRLELHEHLDDHGVMRMRQVPRIDVPAGGMVDLAPGGYHIMIFELVRPLAAGDVVPLDLVFDDGSTLHVDAPVRGAPAGDAHMHHGM